MNGSLCIKTFQFRFTLVNTISAWKNKKSMFIENNIYSMASLPKVFVKMRISTVNLNLFCSWKGSSTASISKLMTRVHFLMKADVGVKVHHVFS